MNKLVLLSLFFSACQSSGFQKYTHETVILKAYEISEVIIPYRQMDISYNENGWEQTDTDERGKVTNHWKATYSGNIEIVHNQGNLSSVKQKNPHSDCTVSQNFFEDGLSEVTTCHNKSERQVHLFKNNTSEYTCSITENELTCATFQNGVLAFKSGGYKDSNAIIHYSYLALDQRDAVSYFMQISQPTSIGQNIEYYSLELPQNSPKPSSTDVRWHLTGKDVKAGLIPETGHFSSIKHYNNLGELSSEEIRSIF